MLVEVVVQPLVGVVDTELFEAVLTEVLKPEDVENPDGVPLVFAEFLFGQ